MKTCNVKIVLDYDELTEAFPGYTFPFNLKHKIKDIRKECGVKHVTDEIVSEFIRDPQLSSITVLTDKVNENARVYKMRISRGDNRGKSNGYRVILLLITCMGTAFVLDITDHKKGEDDLTDEQKQFCNKLCNDIDKEIKKRKQGWG